jgi:hypothetical protein
MNMPKKYAHILYENPKPSENGLYQDAYAFVGTLEQVTEEVAHRANLSYQRNLFAGQEILVADGDGVKLAPGDNYFEVFDLSIVSEIIPDLQIAYGVDEYELLRDVKSFILNRGDIREEEYLRDLHEELVTGQVSGAFPVLPLVVGGIPYREDLVRMFLQENLLLGDVSLDGEIFYDFGALGGDGGAIPFDKKKLASWSMCWMHDLNNEGWPPKNYWVPARS